MGFCAFTKAVSQHTKRHAGATKATAVANA